MPTFPDVKTRQQAKKAGIRLSLNGDNITFKATAKPPPELLAKIKEHKLSIVTILEQEAAGIGLIDAANASEVEVNASFSTRHLDVPNGTETVPNGTKSTIHDDLSAGKPAASSTVVRDLSDNRTKNVRESDTEGSAPIRGTSGTGDNEWFTPPENIGPDYGASWGANLEPGEAAKLAKVRAEIQAEVSRPRAAIKTVATSPDEMPEAARAPSGDATGKVGEADPIVGLCVFVNDGNEVDHDFLSADVRAKMALQSY